MVKLKEMDIWVMIATIIGLLALVLSFLLLIDSIYFQTALIISLLLTALPYTITQYLVYKRAREIEQNLPDFLRDVAESNRSGMPLSKAIENATHGAYGPVSTEFKFVSSQISWGVPFEETLRRFAERVKSKIVRQAILIIIESHKSGGEIADILETVSTDIRTLKRIEMERKSKLKVYLISVYFIFILFLGIILALSSTFIPATPQLSDAAGLLGGNPSTLSEEDFKQYFFHLCLIQAFFAGLIGGQMGEGSPISGIKHSIIMIVMTLFVFQFFLPAPMLGDKLAASILKINPNTVNVESTKTPFTVYDSVNSADLAQTIRTRANSSKLTGYENMTAESITFGYTSCTQCENGNIVISESSIKVVKPSKVTYSIVSSGSGNYRVVIGGTK